MIAFATSRSAYLLSVLLFLIQLLTVSARPQYFRTRRLKTTVDETKLLTNAARMRAGLGPMKPKAFFNPTRVSGTPILPI